MSKIIGIDLGTTNSCVAIMEGGEPVVIPNAEGSRTTPSIVAFPENGERLVGQIAKRQAVTNPERTIFAIKRLIGRRFTDAEIKKAIDVSPFEIMEAENGDAWVKVDDDKMAPPEVSAMVLLKMKATAEDYLGEEVSEAVITVPAYFNDAQRQATKDAGRIAGLDIKRIINEPTAASLAYGLDKQENRTIAVFDLGGGTFDVSVLELSEGVFEVKSTSGDTFLGGEDFDLEIIEFLCKEFEDENGIDLRKDRLALQRLKEAAERAKHELSSSIETEINLPFITADDSGPKHLNLEMTRSKLETLVSGLIEKLEEPCKRAMEDANVSADQIDDIVLVGGMTRMPKVKEKAEQIFGKPPNDRVNPDEVVAIGAAIQGGVLKGDVKDVLLLDVTPLSLGVETMGGVFTKIIERNTTIPCRKGQVFSTAVDNQPMVNVHVLQGERELAADNISLGKFELVGIPPAPRGVPQIEVSFDIDANGILNVTATDLGTGKAQAIRITARSGLSEDQINQMIEDAAQHAEDDIQRKEIIEARNACEGMLFTTEKAVEEFGAKVEPEILAEIKDICARARKAMETDDLEAINEATEDVTRASHRLAEAMYAEAYAEAEKGGDGGDEDEASPD